MFEKEKSGKFNLDLRPSNIAATSIKLEGYSSHKWDVLLIDNPTPFLVFLDEDFMAQELKEYIFILRGLLFGVGFVFRHLAKGIKLLGWQQLSSMIGTLSSQTFLFDFHLAVVFSVS